MAHLLYVLVQLYALLGAAVAVWFLVAHLERVAPAAMGAYAFRPLLIPGLILLWPLVLWRIRTQAAAATSFRRAHRRIWLLLAVALPAIVVAALSLRQNGPREAPPVRLSAP